jgi:hypothetical protein
MDVQEFEQEILKLAFETDARITTASVAYYLGIPSRKANSLLNELLEEGVLELDSDREGNLYYKVPSKASMGSSVIQRVSAEEPTDTQAAAVESDDRPQAESAASNDFAGISLVSPTDESGSEPISPRASRESFDSNRGREQREGSIVESSPSADGSPGQKPRGFRRHGHKPDRDRQGWTGSKHASPVAAREEPATVSAKPRVATMPRQQESVFGNLTMRQGAPDASLDSCGGSNMVVQDTARCEPSPLPSRNKPVVAQCVDEDERKRKERQRARDQEEDFFRRGDRQTGMLTATVGGQVATMDNALDQPEHQPGMALLLSLILCGTGQIYNGEVSKGIMMMVLCFLLWFVLLGWVVHIWSIVDSVVVAERLNRSTG